ETDTRLQRVEPVVELQVGSAVRISGLLHIPADADVELQVSHHAPVVLRVKALDISFSLCIQSEIADTCSQSNEHGVIVQFRRRDRTDQDRCRSARKRLARKLKRPEILRRK